MMKEPTVYIVDDDESVRDALSMLMQAVGLHTATFAGAKDLLLRLNQKDAGCLVLDIRMPGMTGLELQAELYKRRCHLPIIFLTGHADVPLAVKAMKAGAYDFIQKPLDEHRLVIAVMGALKSGADKTRLHGMLPPDNQAGDKLSSLSNRERDVLMQMMEGKQNREIAEAMNISVKTVEFHRANIREKLGVATLPKLFRLVLDR